MGQPEAATTHGRPVDLAPGFVRAIGCRTTEAIAHPVTWMMKSRVFAPDRPHNHRSSTFHGAMGSTPRDNLAVRNVEKTLATLVDLHGPSLIYEADRLEQQLDRQCPEASHEIALVVSALRQRVPQSMLAARSEEHLQTLLPPLVELLVSGTGTDRESATWAVRTWAHALALPATGLDREHPPAAGRHPDTAAANQRSNAAQVLGFGESPVRGGLSSPVAGSPAAQGPVDVPAPIARQAARTGDEEPRIGTGVGSPAVPVAGIRSFDDARVDATAAEPPARAIGVAAADAPTDLVEFATAAKATTSPGVEPTGIAPAIGHAPPAASPMQDATRDPSADPPPVRGPDRTPDAIAPIGASIADPDAIPAATRRPVRPWTLIGTAVAALAIVVIATRWTGFAPTAADPSRPAAGPAPDTTAPSLATRVAADAPPVSSSPIEMARAQPAPSVESPPAGPPPIATAPPSDAQRVATPPVAVAADPPSAIETPPIAEATTAATGAATTAATSPASAVSARAKPLPAPRADRPAPSARRLESPVAATTAQATSTRPTTPASRPPTMVTCTRAACGSVVAARALDEEVGRGAGRAVRYEMIVRMDDRSIQTAIEATRWQPGTRVRKAAGRLERIPAR